ncbi:hypothetical protein ACIRL2_36865 [Embleya sp. NPDC127516]|uniref:hypothetical protein n=1 Tax=Embleya sp. NPDC127516 TaxID=3363990 RepID=UPI0038034DCF
MILPLSLAASFAVPFLLVRGPSGIVAGLLLGYLAFLGLGMHQRAGVGLPLLPSKADRVALKRNAQVIRALRRGDVEGAHEHSKGFPDTPVGQALGAVSQCMVLFARGHGPAGAEVVRRWSAAHPRDDALGRMMSHAHTDFSAMLLVQGSADAAAMLPTLRPAVAGSGRAHRRRGCVAEFALDLYEGRVERAAARARRWRRRAARQRSRWMGAECECLLAICSAAAGDPDAARAALANAERLAYAHPAIGLARARVEACAAAAVRLEPTTAVTEPKHIR